MCGSRVPSVLRLGPFRIVTRFGMGGSGGSAIQLMIFAVGHHVGGEGHAVREIVEGRGLADVPDLLLAEAGGTQRGAVRLLDEPRSLGELPGEVEHRALALREM